VKDDDTAETLAARILEEEHKLYVEAVKRLVREFQQQAASVREAEA
jgi:folate-dependent phosphoribosylglycinamide formyltransferase PurN